MPPSDRDVGTLDAAIPLPHHLSPAAPRKLPRPSSETSIRSAASTASVPRSSSFTGSRRFLTGTGLSARESLGIIDTPSREQSNPHCDYHHARDIIRHSLTHSPKDPPPPPLPRNYAPFVGKRPPTPPPMPAFAAAPKRVRIDPQPPIELPAAAPIDTPPSTISTPEPSLPAKHHDNKRSPLTPLSPLRTTFTVSPSASTPSTTTTNSNAATTINPHHPAARPTLFALLSARIGRRDPLPTTAARASPSASQSKQNAAPLNIAAIATAAKIDYHRRRPHQNKKPPFDPTETSSDDSVTRQVPSSAKRRVAVDQICAHPEQRPHAPLARDNKLLQVGKDNDSNQTTESERYEDCESPVLEPRRRIEIFRRFKFVQEGRQRPEQLSDFIQTDVVENPQVKPVSDPSNIPFDAVDPITNQEDIMSFTSAHEDGERSSDEQAPRAMRDIRKDPRMQIRFPRLLEQHDPKLLEEENGHLPHVESMTTSSSSHSKDTSDSPPVERKMRNVIHDTSVPFTQIEMPHLRLGKGTVSAHAFMEPSPSKMARVAHLRLDSHAAFLNVNGDTKLEDIKYGGHQGERETAPLGPTAREDNPKDSGEIKRTMSGIQRKLKEAGAELVSKAKKIPRSASFAKLRSNSMKDLWSGNSGNGPEKARDAAGETVKKDTLAIQRSKSLPRDSMRQLPKRIPKKGTEEKKSPRKEERMAEKDVKRDAPAEATQEIPEFVTIKRIIRRVRRDGSEEMITKKVRVRPERILPNGDVVIKRTMKRNKDEGEGTETLTVLQVIPRRKNVKKAELGGGHDEADGANKEMESLPDLRSRAEDKMSEVLGKSAQNMYDEGRVKAGEQSGSLAKRRSSVRSKTDMVDDEGRWRRAKSFGRVRGEGEGQEKCEQRGGVIDGMKGLLPRTKSGTRLFDRDTDALGGVEDGRAWLKKKSLPRVMSFHGRNSRRKESGASSKSDGSWWRFRRTAAA